jgi:hypothetical protein
MMKWCHISTPLQQVQVKGLQMSNMGIDKKSPNKESAPTMGIQKVPSRPHTLRDEDNIAGKQGNGKRWWVTADHIVKRKT